MDFDFSLILVVVVGITGAAWLADYLLLWPGRRKAAMAYIDQAGIPVEEWQEYRASGKLATDKSDSREVHLSKATQMARDPVLVEYAKALFPVLFAVLFIRSFLFEPFQIPTGSMIPTLKVGDFIVVNKYAYGIRLPVTGTKIMGIGEPKRGDVMVFIPPHDPTYYIKRVIGLPGDHVLYKDKVLYINGEAVEQEFVATLQEGRSRVIYNTEALGEVEHDIYLAPTDVEYRGVDYWLPPEGRVIPEGHYFMMGDNRDNSDDSRRWGPVSEDKIVGKAVAVWMHKEPGSFVPSFGDNRLINK